MRKTEIEETNMTDINKIENGPMLNLYPDSLGGDLEAVADLFEKMDLQMHFPQCIYYRVFTILIWIVVFCNRL